MYLCFVLIFIFNYITQELKLKDEEVARLSQIRDEVGAELEELTASLFEVSTSYYLFYHHKFYMLFKFVNYCRNFFFLIKL